MVNETSFPLLVLAFIFLMRVDFHSFDLDRAELGCLPRSNNSGSCTHIQDRCLKALRYIRIMTEDLWEEAVLVWNDVFTHSGATFHALVLHQSLGGLSPNPHLQSCLKLGSWSKLNSPSSLSICFKSCSLAPSSVFFVGWFGVDF